MLKILVKISNATISLLCKLNVDAATNNKSMTFINVKNRFKLEETLLK